MIKLRVMTAAFLRNNDEFLMMHRSNERKLAAGLWAGIGGHLEPDEINDPEKACIREIYEETGIENKDITNMRLKYIILRRSKAEIRIQYIYFGDTSARVVGETDEGELFWIKKDELMERQLSQTTTMTLKHYFSYGMDIEDVMVGTVSAEHNKPVMNWVPLQDWEGI